MLPKPFLKEGIASLTSLISTLVLLLGLAAAAFLVQNQQEVREKAAPQPCRVCHGLSNCVEIEIPPYCNAGENECFENADCVLTPTPTPGACTVSYENRGCGRNNCSQTSMWQLVTNADCTVTSRCVPNYPECLITPTPSPYCSTGNLVRCLYGCEPDLYGGRCKPQPIPTPYCSNSANLAGGVCARVSQTPADCLVDCLNDGNTPSECNAICQAIINPPSYCTSTTNLVCAQYEVPHICVPDTYGGHCVIDETKVKQEGEVCNQNSDCKSGRCDRPYDYGVKICVPYQTCTPGDFIPRDPDVSLSCSWKCSDDGKNWLKQYDDCTEKIEDIKRYCEGNVPVYEETTDTGVKIQYRSQACEAGCSFGFCITEQNSQCLTGDISYVQGSCKDINGCPSPNKNYDGNCLAECDSNGEWNVVQGCGNVDFFGNWTESERLDILLTISEFSDTLFDFTGPLDFKRLEEYNIVTTGFDAWMASLFGNYQRDEDTLRFCADTRYTTGFLGDIVVNEINVADCGANKDTYAHEIGHHFADQLENNFTGYQIAVGCELHPFSSERYTFAKEQPVSGYGETNCEEAHSEAASMYLTQPCPMKDEFPIQYDWMKDNYFEGKDSCYLEQGMPLFQSVSRRLANLYNQIKSSFLTAKADIQRKFLALQGKVPKLVQVYAGQSGPSIGPFELGTLKSDLTSSLGSPSSTTKEGGLTALTYTSPGNLTPNVYILDEANKLVYFRLGKTSIPQEYDTPKSFSNIFGNPEIIISSNALLDSTRLLYPRNGFSLVVDNFSDRVLLYEQFKPSYLQEYLDTWGKDIDRTKTLEPLVTIDGDINRDSDVDIFDYNGLVEDFGSSARSYADIDTNGKVDIFDYNLLIENFGS